jgi:tRNA threonylcarbamoyladenosine biosynthesis protein TsaB
MLILALDTTTAAGSVALLRNGLLAAQRGGNPAITHGERLPGDILSMLEELQLRPADIDLYAVAAGPGSFTGLRVGIATVQGLALVHDKRVVAVSTLDALAHACRALGLGDELIAAWVDAQRGQVFAALYGREGFTPLEPATALPPHETLLRWRPHVEARSIAFVGDGAVRYKAEIEACYGPANVIDPGPLAATIAVLAAERARDGDAVPPHGVRAIYVRRPDAELARDGERR